MPLIEEPCYWLCTLAAEEDRRIASPRSLAAAGFVPRHRHDTQTY